MILKQEFAPITITLESKTEKDFLMNVLYRAQERTICPWDRDNNKQNSFIIDLFKYLETR